MFKRLKASQKALQLGFFAALIVLMLTSGLSIWGTQRLIADVGWINHSQQVLTTIRSLGATLDRLEAAPSKHAIRSQADLIEVYATDAQLISSAIDQLKTLTANNDSQQRRLNTLTTLVKNELAIIQLSFQSAATPSAAAALLNDSANLPKLDTSIGQELQDMLDEEESLLSTRSNQSTVSAQLAISLSLAGAVGSGIAIFFCGSLLARADAAQKEASGSLAVSEQRARTQYKSLPMPTYTWRKVGDDLILVDYNDKAMQITRGRIAELIGLSAKVRYINEPDILAKFWQCYNSQQTLTWESYFESTLAGNSQYLLLTCVYVAPDMVMVHTLDETERKRAEAERRESQMFSIRIAESSPNIIYIYDVEQQRSIYWNREIGTQLGYSSIEIQAAGPDFMATMMHPDDWGKYRRHVKDISAAPDSSITEIVFRMQAKQGDWWWFNIRAVVFSRRPDGTVRQYLSTIENITERKRIEETLASERHLMRVMIDQLPDYIFVKDREGRYLIANLAQAAFAGKSKPQDLIGKKASELFSPAIAALLDADDSVAIDQGVVLFNGERELINASGKEEWVLTTKIPLRDAEDKIIGLVGISHDISDERKARLALRESEERLRRITDNMLDVIFQIDNERMIKYASPSSWTVLGYEPSELVGYKLDDDVHLDDLQTLQTGILTEGKAEYRYRHADGHYVWLETISAPLFDTEGNRVGMVFTSRDVSERQAILRSLQDAKVQAESASAAKSIFLANMSHELRTPLNAILGFTQLLAQDHALAEEHRKYVDIISHSGEHLLGLINEVLEIAKIEAGRAVLNEEDFDLSRMFDSLEEMLKIRAVSKGLQLLFERDAALPQFVRTDPSKVRQVLINLVNNAIKFTQEGGVTVRIQPRAVQRPVQGESDDATFQAASLAFEIEDTGQGMSVEEIATLFTSFTQTKSGLSAQEGTGLGLTISREFVRLMGGELVVTSREGKGTLIKFSIDILIVEAEQMPSAPETRRVTKIADGQPDYRILIVEDRLENRILLSKLMKGVGFDTREAVNGREGIEVWEQWRPDLIWMDMRMPVMDGFEATQYIRDHNQGAKPVIIALTASAFEHERTAVIATGCDDLVPKPFQSISLFEKMTEHLGVQFDYEENAQTAPTVAAAPTAALTSAAMKSVPMITRKHLRQAALELDSESALEVIDQVRGQDAVLADRLDDYVRTFRFDSILDLIDRAEE